MRGHGHIGIHSLPRYIVLYVMNRVAVRPTRNDPFSWNVWEFFSSKMIFYGKKRLCRTDYTLPARVFRTPGITFYIADESRLIATKVCIFLVIIKYYLLYTYLQLLKYLIFNIQINMHHLDSNSIHFSEGGLKQTSVAPYIYFFFKSGHAPPPSITSYTSINLLIFYIHIRNKINLRLNKLILMILRQHRSNA